MKNNEHQVMQGNFAGLPLNPRGKAPDDTIKTNQISEVFFGNPPTNYYRMGEHPLGKTPEDFWSITTKPFKGAHFAVFPEALVEQPIQAACPQWICTQCGKPKTRQTKRIAKIGAYRTPGSILNVNPHDKREVDSSGRAGESLFETVGWRSCDCHAKFEPGVVLDPFCGAGTTCLVARKLCRNYIGIELNPDYVAMAQQRLAAIPARLDDLIMNGEQY
jgi:hypothetical protein